MVILDYVASGQHNGNWKGGKSIASNGYVLVRVGLNHHLADIRGYAYEHRVVAEKVIGRRLLKGEQVHHLNGIKTDNRPTNITVMASMARHRYEHRKPGSKRRLLGEENPVIQCACGCGQWIFRFDGTDRRRAFVSGHNPRDIARQTAFLAACGNKGASIREITARTGQSLRAVKCMASKLVRENKLIRIGRGIYGKRN